MDYIKQASEDDWETIKKFFFWTDEDVEDCPIFVSVVEDLGERFEI